MKMHSIWLSVFLVTFIGVSAANETALIGKTESTKSEHSEDALDAFKMFLNLNPRTKLILSKRVHRHAQEQQEETFLGVLNFILKTHRLLFEIAHANIIGMKTGGNDPDPITITGFTDHAVDRSIDDKGRNGVGLDAISDALKDPWKIEKGNSGIPQEESTRIFWGKQAKVVLSTRKDTLGSIVTVCPVHSNALIKDPSRSGKRQGADPSSIRQQEKKEKKNQRAAMRDVEKMIHTNEIARLPKPVQYKIMAYSSERLKAKKIKNSEDVESMLPIGDRVFKTSKKTTYSDTLLNTVSMAMIPMQALVYYKMQSYSRA